MQGTILDILRDPKLGLPVENPSSLVVSRIQQYLDLLVKWNRKINLTAEKTPQEILQRHIFDSLQYSRFIEPKYRVLDIGSGAGFPGIPLKIIFPDLQLVMVESQRKRCSFLDTVVRELALGQVKVVNSRAENISDSEDGQFGSVVFRAVTESQACLALAERFLPSGGKVILKKPLGEALDPLVSDPLFGLQEEITITSYHGVVSSLLVFEKCFT
jgi:16S rRNA (guanine527-N7)-methyltransferase